MTRSYEWLSHLTILSQRIASLVILNDSLNLSQLGGHVDLQASGCPNRGIQARIGKVE